MTLPNKTRIPAAAVQTRMRPTPWLPAIVLFTAIAALTQARRHDRRERHGSFLRAIDVDRSQRCIQVRRAGARWPGSCDRHYNFFDHSYAMPVAGWLGDRVNQPGRTWRVTAGYSF